MPLEIAPEALTERLYVLTLALADAAERADPSELTALFDQRERVIGQLASMELPLSVLPRFESIEQAERATLKRLLELKSLTAREIGRGVKASQVAGAYRTSASAVVLDSYR